MQGQSPRKHPRWGALRCAARKVGHLSGQAGVSVVALQNLSRPSRYAVALQALTEPAALHRWVTAWPETRRGGAGWLPRWRSRWSRRRRPAWPGGAWGGAAQLAGRAAVAARRRLPPRWPAGRVPGLPGRRPGPAALGRAPAPPAPGPARPRPPRPLPPEPAAGPPSGAAPPACRACRPKPNIRVTRGNKDKVREMKEFSRYIFHHYRLRSSN
jgi:hypothetical protein